MVLNLRIEEEINKLMDQKAAAEALAGLKQPPT